MLLVICKKRVADLNGKHRRHLRRFWRRRGRGRLRRPGEPFLTLQEGHHQGTGRQCTGQEGRTSVRTATVDVTSERTNKL